MKKVFDFVESLTSLFHDVFGFPTINVYSEIVEVTFETDRTIRDLSIFELSGPDEFRLFAKGDSLVCVYTFYLEND